MTVKIERFVDSIPVVVEPPATQDLMDILEALAKEPPGTVAYLGRINSQDRRRLSWFANQLDRGNKATLKPVYLNRKFEKEGTMGKLHTVETSTGRKYSSREGTAYEYSYDAYVTYVSARSVPTD